MRNPSKGGPGLPVATSISTRHDAGSIRRFLELFLLDAVKVCGFNHKPMIVMIDGSMAMWNAVLRAFANETRVEYYHRCWRIVTSKPSAGDMKKTFVQNCLSHAMRAAKLIIGKYYKRAYKHVAMFWISALFSVSTFDQLESIMESITAITNCENSSRFVKQHFENIKHCTDLDINRVTADMVNENISNISSSPEEDFFYASKGTDEKQELNSPFYLHFTKKLNNFLQSENYQSHKRNEKTDHNIANVYFGNVFCQKLIRIIVCRICCTSKLMLGDLSRHKSSRSNNDIKKLFDNYSAFYKILQNTLSNITVEKNLTQGIIEQHFNSLKKVYLKGNRIGRIDDFVQKYYTELKITQKLFSDYAFHSVMKNNKSKKQENPRSTSVVLSKFRKRKRQQTAYYASSLAKKKINFIGADTEIKRNNSFDKELLDQTLHCNYGNEAHLDVNDKFKLMDYYKKHLTNAIKFSDLVWNSLPGIYNFPVTQIAMQIDHGHQLTWLDLHSLNSSTNQKVYSEMVKHLKQPFCTGWVSKYIIDSYISLLTKQFNIENNEQMFGSLDCDDSTCILQNKIKNKAIFNNRLMIKKTQNIRPHILAPILFENHFLLLWYSNINHTLFLINSLRKDSSSVAEITKKSFINFFGSLQSSGRSPVIKFEVKTGLVQPDNSSCGVCVCMAADMICRKKQLSFDKTLPKSQILEYRNWMLYILYLNSTSCCIEITEACKDMIYNYVIGLSNIANNCWFNAVVQAIVRVLQAHKYITNKSDLNLETNNNFLFSLFYFLLKKTEVSDNFLENTLRVVCQQCGFTFGEQQDPDEFFQCSILQNVLAKNNITCLVKFSKQFKCITCLKAGETEFFKQIILRLPLFDTIDDGHSLSKYIEQFMRANECKYCVFCRKVRNHKTCAAFMSFPNLLVVNLARNVDTVKCGKKVSLSSYVQIKGKDCSDLDAMYELVSVVVHLGEKVEGGHFVCYFFLNGNDIIEINDQSVRKLDLS